MEFDKDLKWYKKKWIVFPVIGIIFLIFSFISITAVIYIYQSGSAEGAKVVSGTNLSSNVHRHSNTNSSDSEVSFYDNLGNYQGLGNTTSLKGYFTFLGDIITPTNWLYARNITSENINNTQTINTSGQININGNPVSPWLYNQSDGSFNSSYLVNIDQRYNETLTITNMNSSWLSTFNSSYLVNTDQRYNSTLTITNMNSSWLSTFNTSYLVNTDQRYNETLTITNMNSSWLSTFNSTYASATTQISNSSISFLINNSFVISNTTFSTISNKTYLQLNDTRYNETLTITNMNSSWLSTYNASYDFIFDNGIINDSNANLSSLKIANNLTVLGNFSVSGKNTRSRIENGSLCIGNGSGCTAPSTNGRLLIGGTISTGGAATQVYNAFGTLGFAQPSSGAITGSNDVYVSGDIEVDGTAYLAGGVYWTIGDIAENLQTVESRKNKICNGDVSCLKNNTDDNLDYGDLVCIDVSINRTIMKCDKANSKLVVGFVSETAVLNVGSFKGYPISLAGLVPAHVTNENGNVMPGDLLVSSSKPGYAMKNDDPKIGTIVGKAFDFCDKPDCKIPVFVALS